MEAEFVVISGKGRPLLSLETAVQLGVLKLGPQINSIDPAFASQAQSVLKAL